MRRLSLPPVRLSSTGPPASRSGATAATSPSATSRAPSRRGACPGGRRCWRAAPAARGARVTAPLSRRSVVDPATAARPVNGVTEPSGKPGLSSAHRCSGSWSSRREAVHAAQVARSATMTAPGNFGQVDRVDAGDRGARAERRTVAAAARAPPPRSCPPGRHPPPRRRPGSPPRCPLRPSGRGAPVEQGGAAVGGAPRDLGGAGNRHDRRIHGQRAAGQRRAALRRGGADPEREEHRGVSRR